MYWCFQTVTTVGYGDIMVQTYSEFILSIFWMYFGCVFFSFTIGNLSSALGSMDTKSAILKQKIGTLTDFSRKIDMPLDTEFRIRKFLTDNNKDQVSLEDQERLLHELPPTLKSEVIGHTHGHMVKTIQFFHDKNADFLMQILPLLKPFRIYKHDILYSQGDNADDSKI